MRFPFSIVRPAGVLMAVLLAACPGIIHGEEPSVVYHLPKGEKSPGKLCTEAQVKALAAEWRKIPIHTCGEKDVTFLGLLELLNRRLKEAHRMERVFTCEEYSSWTLQDIIRRATPFNRYEKIKGTLDRKELAKHIAAGTVYDLMDNLNLWTASYTAVFPTGVYLGWGPNWPKTEPTHEYPVVFGNDDTGSVSREAPLRFPPLREVDGEYMSPDTYYGKGFGVPTDVPKGEPPFKR